MPEQVLAHAPAKLNLALAVGSRDAGGLHPICSWMVTVDLCDELLITKLPDDRFSRYAVLWHEEAKRRSDIDWPIRSDLAVRAHLALEAHVGRRLPAQLKIEKRIPVGGGLGGGSSNAAAMLHAVNALFELGLSTDALANLGSTLGSDVPFLVHGGSALVSGFGDRIERQDDAPALDLVLVFPDAVCPTGEVYDAFDDHPAPAFRETELREMMAADLIPSAGARLFNDLEHAAIEIAPPLEDLLQHVGELAERPARLSGSGSSAFVLCDDPMHAGHLAAAIESRHGVPAVPVRTTPHLPQLTRPDED